jgi:hypothetical protein
VLKRAINKETCTELREYMESVLRELEAIDHATLAQEDTAS